jgi:branched-chain amino acid transport system substrate-binding protein
MKVTIRRFAVAAITIAALFGLGGAVAAADLKLGATFSLTGGTDDYGRAALMGLQLAVKEYNAKGGYQGKQWS